MPKTKDLNHYVGLRLKAEYTDAELTLETLSERTGIPYSTLRKKIANDSPITVTDLVAISAAIGVSAEEVLDKAVRNFGGIEKLKSGLSEAPDNVTALPKRPNTAEEIDNYRGERAAHQLDSEADQPDE